MPQDEFIGTLRHYDQDAHRATLHVDHGALRQGDMVRVRAEGIDFDERVRDLFREGEHVDEAHEGDDVEVPLTHDLPRGAPSRGIYRVYVVHDPYRTEAGEVVGELFR